MTSPACRSSELTSAGLRRRAGLPVRPDQGAAAADPFGIARRPLHRLRGSGAHARASRTRATSTTHLVAADRWGNVASYTLDHRADRRLGDHRAGLGHREWLHPALPVRDHRLHARLLQHDLADPDRIRIARTAPGQVAPVTAVVRDDSARRDRGVIHAASVVQVDHHEHCGVKIRPIVVSLDFDVMSAAVWRFDWSYVDERVGHAHREVPVTRSQ